MDRRSFLRILGVALIAATGVIPAVASVTQVATPDTGETVMVDSWPSGQFCIVDHEGRQLIRSVTINGVEQVTIRGDLRTDGLISASDFDAECDDGEAE